MIIPTHVLLGAIAGVTIFLGLPVARSQAVSERMRGLLALASAGVILFLVIEVSFQAMQRVESAALGGGGSALGPSLLLVGGFALGLVGLAWLEDRRRHGQARGAGPMEVAAMIAIGIGLHNFAEGLAIGQSFSSGATALGTVLVAGFALHNATEGFGIAGPLAGQHVPWSRLLTFGLIGGGPTVLGALIGGIWINAAVELLFLAVAAGSLVYVARELLRIRLDRLASVAATTALTIGLFVGFGTELAIDVGQAGLSASNAPATATVRFVDTRAEPASVSLTQGEGLEIRNETDHAIIIEGNGLFPGEVAVPAAGSITVRATGPAGEYGLVDERGMSGTAHVSLLPAADADPLLEHKYAVGALTILEGHVRAARELHNRGVRGEGPHPEADLMRAPAHAGHPQGELLRGDQPDALALQNMLRQHDLLDVFDQTLTRFVERAGDVGVSAEEFNTLFRETLAAVEEARRAIAGANHDRADFRLDVIRFVLETAAAEYATSVQGGRIAVETPGTPGSDDFIEYQDARAFVSAARELSAPVTEALPPGATQAFDVLERNILRTLDPAVPDAPIPADAVRTVIGRITG